MTAPDPLSGPTLRTDRLVLSPLVPDDVGELYDLFTTPEVRRFLLDDEVVSREWVEEEVRASAARFDAGDGGLWALRERESTPLVGFVGFRDFFDPPERQLLYGLDPRHWGKGFATEAARAAIEYALDELDFRVVRAATDTPNEASIAVLTRLGFREWERTDAGEHGTVFFRLMAGE